MLRSISTRIVGTYFDVRRIDPGSRLPLTRRQVGAMVLGDRHTLVFNDQAASADASHLVDDISVTQSQAGVIDRTSKHALVLKGDELTFIRVPLPPGRDYLWSERIRPQFLPLMAEDDWQLQVLGSEASRWEAVVDRTAGMSRPYPWWIRYSPLGRADGGADHPKDAAGVIALRPMMAMDAMTLWVNAAGRVIAADVPENSGLTSGAVWILHRPATQRDVVAQYPRNADYLRIWQQEAPNHE
jgi:hypothetical protein